MATLYKANGDIATIKPRSFRKRFSVKELQKAVGGYIQCIDLNGNYLIVDEDGFAKERPYNFNASAISFQFGFGHVVGDAVYCKEEEMPK